MQILLQKKKRLHREGRLNTWFCLKSPQNYQKKKKQQNQVLDFEQEKLHLDTVFLIKRLCECWRGFSHYVAT